MRLIKESTILRYTRSTRRNHHFKAALRKYEGPIYRMLKGTLRIWICKTNMTRWKTQQIAPASKSWKNASWRRPGICQMESLIFRCATMARPHSRRPNYASFRASASSYCLDIRCCNLARSVRSRIFRPRSSRTRATLTCWRMAASSAWHRAGK